EQASNLKVIWKSPLIPSDLIVWRKDLPAETKTKLKTFFLDYGVKGKDVQRELAVLTALQWKPFKSSDNNQLLPIRQLALFQNRSKVEGDKILSDKDKAEKLADIDKQLADLNAQMAKLAAK